MRKHTQQEKKENKRCSQHQFCYINLMLPATNMGEMGRNEEFNTAPVKVIIICNQWYLGNGSMADTKQKVVNGKLLLIFTSRPVMVEMLPSGSSLQL